MKREQRGYVFRKANSWFLRYRDRFVENGTTVSKQVCRRLGPVAEEHARLKRPPASVLLEAKVILNPLNAGTEASGNPSIEEFVKSVWFTSVEERCTASTQHAYKYYWAHILQPLCGEALLRDFTTRMAQQLLSCITRQNPEMKKTTLHKLKSILSSIFTVAKQQGCLPLGAHPIRDTWLPRGAKPDETAYYPLDEVLTMLRIVPEPSRTAIAIAAFAGLRRGEISGLLWEAYDPKALTLRVSRSVWEGNISEPKTRKSNAAVPVIPSLGKILDAHWVRCGKPEAGIMFKTKNNTPFAMNNLLSDQIRPVLYRCVHCAAAKEKHATADHKYQRDSSLPEWKGFHSFRRGLATNLHALGVDDLTIQRILRHSNVAVTQQCYIKTLPEQSIAAMKKLDQLVDLGNANWALCNDSATAVSSSKLLQ
jgi:integrase